MQPLRARHPALLPARERVPDGQVPSRPGGGRGTRLAAWGRADAVLTDDNYAMLERLESWAGERGHTVLELAVGWLASQSHVASVISGATKPEQLDANAAAVDWQLTAEEVAEVASLVG